MGVAAGAGAGAGATAAGWLPSPFMRCRFHATSIAASPHPASHVGQSTRDVYPSPRPPRLIANAAGAGSSAVWGAQQVPADPPQWRCRDPARGGLQWVLQWAWASVVDWKPGLGPGTHQGSAVPESDAWTRRGGGGSGRFGDATVDTLDTGTTWKSTDPGPLVRAVSLEFLRIVPAMASCPTALVDSFVLDATHNRSRPYSRDEASCTGGALPWPPRPGCWVSGGLTRRDERAPESNNRVTRSRSAWLCQRRTGRRRGKTKGTEAAL
ncbi:hypothetical protein ACCO45_006454 [Purpureocillium lilacinum]|uniref:Uncharacterized protein n=1 Tax=Purpureocillium lilacinum TaxID=33203 RepID=A0ACC4DQZ6_PURLI